MLHHLEILQLYLWLLCGLEITIYSVGSQAQREKDGGNGKLQKEQKCYSLPQFVSRVLPCAV